MQALSHFSYHVSGGRLLLCDLQGAGDDVGGAIITDPAILSFKMSYGSTDMGPSGILDFLEKHECNRYCHNNWLRPSTTSSFLCSVGSTTRWNGMTAQYGDENSIHTYEPQVTKKTRKAVLAAERITIGATGVFDGASTFGEFVNEVQEELDVEQAIEEYDEEGDDEKVEDEEEGYEYEEEETDSEDGEEVSSLPATIVSQKKPGSIVYRVQLRFCRVRTK